MPDAMEKTKRSHKVKEEWDHIQKPTAKECVKYSFQTLISTGVFMLLFSGIEQATNMVIKLFL